MVNIPGARRLCRRGGPTPSWPVVVALLLALPALNACGIDRADDRQGPDRSEGVAETDPVESVDPVDPVDPVRWESVVAEHRSPDCDEKSPDAACAHARLAYPEFEGDDALARALGHWTAERILAPAMFEGEPAPSADAVARDFVEAHDRYRAEFPQAASGGWDLDRSVQVKRRSPPVVVLVASEQAYAGGAHPSYWVQHQAFRPDTGEPLTLERILRAGAEADVQALLEARFRADLGLPADAPLADTGLFEDLPPLDNLDWAPEGLTFHYNPYAVGPWSMGVTRVRLPWDAVAPHLRDDVVDLLAPWLSPSSP